jgi:hypothetical protein
VHPAGTNGYNHTKQTQNPHIRKNLHQCRITSNQRISILGSSMQKNILNTRFKRAPTCNHNRTTKSAQQMACDEVGGEMMKAQLHLAPSSVIKKQACENRGTTRTEAVPEPAASSQLSGEVAFSPEAKSKLQSRPNSALRRRHLLTGSSAFPQLRPRSASLLGLQVVVRLGRQAALCIRLIRHDDEGSQL